jgi:hypothetical protein
MVIGIAAHRKQNGREEVAVCAAPSTRPIGPKYSNCLLRRRDFFRSRIGRRCVRIGRHGVRIGRDFTGRRIDHGRISRFRRWRHFLRRSRRFFGRNFHILLGTAGTQYKGNRNGAQEICIHRQLPQFIWLSEKNESATKTPEFFRIGASAREPILPLLPALATVANQRHYFVVRAVHGQLRRQRLRFREAMAREAE